MEKKTGISLDLKLNTKEKGLVADYLHENRKTKFSIGLLSQDKDLKFNDGVMKFEQKGIGSFDLAVKNGIIDEFMLTLEYPGKENIRAVIGGKVNAVGINGRTYDPRLEIQIDKVKIIGEASGRSLREDMRKFDGKFAIEREGKRVEVIIEDGKVIGLGGSIGFSF